MYPSDAEVSLGEELTPTAVKDEPKVTWIAEPDSKYTLIMSGNNLVALDSNIDREKKVKNIIHYCTM